jgi:hypothetical protein
MKVFVLALAAVVPLMAPWDDESLTSSPPCHVGIDLQVRAALPWGPVEWTVLTSEVDHIWAQYGVTFCWATADHPCDGLRVRLRVVVEDDASVPGARPAAAPTPVGWIWFTGASPAPEIHLSVRGARAVVDRARIGSRPIAMWPPATAAPFVPRVLGRALAHEAGHFLLQSRQHTRGGLMSATLRPDQTTFDGDAAFGLTRALARQIRAVCQPPVLAAGSHRAR